MTSLMSCAIAASIRVTEIAPCSPRSTSAPQPEDLRADVRARLPGRRRGDRAPLQGARQARRLGLRDDLRRARRRDRRRARLLPVRRTGTTSATTCSGTSSPARGWSGTAGAIGGALAVVRLGVVARLPGARAARPRGAVPLALGYAIGRIGCQLSGDGDYGKRLGPPVGDVVSGRHRARPTRRSTRRRSTRRSRWGSSRGCSGSGATASGPGVLFALYLVLAGLERFLVEFVRRNDETVAGLTTPQLESLALMRRGRRVDRGRQPAAGRPGGATRRRHQPGLAIARASQRRDSPCSSASCCAERWSPPSSSTSFFGSCASS